MHRGEIDFCSRVQWGKEYDDEYGMRESVVPWGFPNDIPGWLHKDEGEELGKLAAGKDVLEVGSYCGRSTICMAQSARSVTCMDYWDGRGTGVPADTLETFQKNIQRYAVGHKVTIAHPESTPPNESFDLIFIDGDHSQESVAADIDKALLALRPGGLIAFHDYKSPLDPGVTAAVDEFISAGAKVISQTNTLAVVRPPVSVSA
jgi:predicted O-methyltransferase YrrM